ncbi:MAG: cobyrinate a,c-diamide synthase [Clostridia bacterium]|nr:cobyrinate a,c-diamide synthase [Clostridia bacterium]
MTKALPRVLIAGTSSGCGKTTAVCALLTLMRRRGVRVTAAKCGPDYIDPMFHETALGVPSANLDPFFCDGNLLRALLAEQQGTLSVIEGVMGYYDGTGADGTENSTYTVARETDTPAVLVVNGRGASASLLAVLEGFLNFTPASGIRGVLFSGMTAMTYSLVKRLAKERFGERITLLGFIPRLPEDCVLPSRHLGLVTAGELENLRAILERIADLCEREHSVDLDALLALAASAPALEFEPREIPRVDGVRLALARDAAFCFIYPDTLRLFEKMGAEILPFSPLNDEAVPSSADGLLLPGGYPELYAERLEKNETFRLSVKRAVLAGMPTIAECGGFQVLGSSLDGHEMCGLLPHESRNTGKLVRFGYCTLTSGTDGLLGPAGTTLRAHEFHYYDSTDNGRGMTAAKPNGKSWECAVHTETLYAGYPHLFLPSALPSAEAFCRKCLAFKEKRT